MKEAPGSTADWLGQALRVLALALRHEVALARTLRGDGHTEGFMGLLLSADEAEALLAEASGRLRVSGTAACAATLAGLEAQLDAARRTASSDPFCTLAQHLGLDDQASDLLLLACAPALDARFGTVYGYLNNDMARRYLTPELACRVLEHRGATLGSIRAQLGEDSALGRCGALQVGTERPWIQAPIRLDELLLDRLLGLPGHGFPPAAGGIPLPLAAGTTGSPPPAAGIWLAADTPDGSGALTALQAAQALADGLLLLEPEQFTSQPAEMLPWLRSALREATLNRLLPVLRGFDTLPPALRTRIAGLLRPPVLILAQSPAAWQDAQLRCDPLPGTTLTRAEAVDLLLAAYPHGSEPLRGWLSRLQRLDPLVLGLLLQTHRDEAQLRAALRQRLGQPLAKLADQLTVGYTMDDLVLPPRTRQALVELATWHGTAQVVREQWRFGQVFGRGSGTTALFKGPSGTGKTMAAAAVGDALGLPVFRVNLAGLVSKYIGETEKNLDRLFDAADGSDVVLFFDEADAIFGKRSEVHDAHDRYANLETAYLLQRIERHAGICILASNLHQNIDEAFVRRLDLVVDFPAPSQAARKRIWQRLNQGLAPLDERIDFDLLAERFELTGGEIRNCVLAAAHLAAADGAVITMDLLMASIARELAKAGKPIRRTDFGEHYTHSRTGKGA
ncbi:ATP-binding protein [Glutamicibacter sp. MNS18]|uniref:ATP-binding protein n=1 Tax=Glutamicibacter sp. MNS18 TaxID=2989817 RepID=UPI0022363A00|nr:ATP-binding protein [Glutamicibacter sp. MNS18]MCW4464552.1 ATP-binding protein [Glutamicibacter sp. MNS18]